MGNPPLPFSALAAVPLLGLVAALVINRAAWCGSLDKPLLGMIGRCAVCGARLPWGALLPGWELTRAGARPPCGHPLPRWRLPNVLLLTLGGAALAALHRGSPWPALAQAVLLLLVLDALALIDLVSLVVETRLVLLGLLLRFLGLALFAGDEVVDMIAGMLMGAGLFTMVEAIYRTLRGRQGLGEGDAAAMGLIGAFVGWEGVLPVVAIGAVAGLVVGLPALLAARRSLATPIPFVPFLAAAGMAIYLAQTVWTEHWMRLILAIRPVL